MKKHTRFWSVLLTSFLLVGLTTVAALAENTFVDVSVSPNTITLQPGGAAQSATVTITAKSGQGDSVKGQAFTVTVTLPEGNIVTANETTGTITPVERTVTSGMTSTTVVDGTKTFQFSPGSGATDGATGEVSINVAFATAVNETVKLTVNVKDVATPVISADPAPIVWGEPWSLTPEDTTGTAGTWSIDDTLSGTVLSQFKLAFSNGVFSLAESATKWEPNKTELDQIWKNCKGTGEWKGDDMEYTFKLTKTQTDDPTKTATADVKLTFKGIDVALTASPDKDEFVFTYGTAPSANNVLTAYGPGNVSWDIPELPAGLKAAASTLTNNATTLTISGTPTETCKSVDITFKATINGGTAHALSYPTTISVKPDAAGVTFTDNDKVPSGDVSFDYEFAKEATPVKVVAKPGPIVWSGYDFLKTAGLTVTESGDANTELWIYGSFNGTEITETTSSDYTIKAQNKYYTDISKDIKVKDANRLTVWVKPTFPTNLYTVPTDKDKKGKHEVIKAASEYTKFDSWAKDIDIGNIPAGSTYANTYKVEIGGVKVLENSTPVTGAKYSAVDSSGNSSDKHGLFAAITSGKLSISGDLDRIPASKDVDIVVYATNFAGENSKDYTVSVIGNETKITAKKDITLNGYGVANENSTDIKITAGEPTQIMTAKIDYKTAYKVFGKGDGKNDDGGIDLLADGPKYGIYIDSSDMEHGQLAIYLPSSKDTAPAYVDPSQDWKAYAFKKLPITVTTKNPDYEYTDKGLKVTKIATEKVTLSYPADAKKAEAKIVAPFADTLAGNGLSTSSDTTAIATKEELFVAQGEVIETKYASGDKNPFIFVAEGNGPFTLTYKPTDATNGLTAKEIEYTTKDGFVRKAIQITGTPAAAAKDLSTKFSITAKNNSTGTSAKTTVTITAMPVVEITETDAKPFGNLSSKPATVGGKLKVAPKISKNSKNIYWSIVSADWDNNEIKGSDTVSASQDLYNKYGIELSDPIKGTLGTKKGEGLKMATGTTTPLKVLLRADTLKIATKKASDADIAEALKAPLTTAYATAKIYIAGEKMKLDTKSVTITISGDAANPTYDYGVPIEFKAGKVSATSVDKGTEVFTGKVHSASYYKAYMAPTDTYAYDKSSKPTYGTTMNTVAANFAGDKVKDYLEGLKLVVSGDNINAFKLSGTPKAATKKAALDLVMNNWGTVTTGKVSVIIKGQKPLPVATPASVTIDSNDKIGKDVTITLSNKAYVGSKIKWKVTSKTEGVKAKFKAAEGDKNGKEGGTLTITTDKKFATAQTVTLTATDGDDKNNIGTVEIKVTPSFASGGSSSALEATDDTMSAKDEAEAKVLGEGTVTMHGQRTVASLTAGQRAQIEAQGYIVAAVLPEIEVDADGQYDFEVDLDADERVKAGDELVWFAFASKPTTDDEIVDFEDVDGNETKVVPEIAEGHEHPVVVAWPWLNAGTKYAPVIAVKADAAEADAMTEEGVKEAAEEAKEE